MMMAHFVVNFFLEEFMSEENFSRIEQILGRLEEKVDEIKRDFSSHAEKDQENFRLLYSYVDRAKGWFMGVCGVLGIVWMIAEQFI